MKRVVSTLLLSLLTVAGVFAQKEVEVYISDLSIRKIDNALSVSFNALTTRLGTNYQLRLTPVLCNDSQSKSLTPIVVMGKKRAAINKRHQQPLGEDNNRVAGRDKTLISYKLSIPYEPWMNRLSLDIHRTIQGCCQEVPLATYQALSDQLIDYTIEPLFNAEVERPQPSALQEFVQTIPFLYPAADYDRRSEIFAQQRRDGALMVYCQQGSALIDSTYKNNQQTLDQVAHGLNLIEADPNASLKKIVLVGLASPEGTLALNNVLAGKRVNSLKHLVSSRMKHNSDLVELINGSEDWDGLRKLVEESHMPERQQVLEIMERYSAQDDREVALMKLHGGTPYRYMKEHFFAQLRNAGYIQIYYELRPDPAVQQLNRGIELMRSRQYDKALPLLLESKGNKQLENRIGVCYMMLGNYEQATSCFEQAIARGNSDAADAARNLEQIRLVQSIK